MKQTVHPNSQVPQSSAIESSSRSLGQTGADGRAPGHLAQLAATINQSSRVQAQLKLAEELQGGAAPAQRAPKKEKLAQKVGKPDEKKTPGQLQADPKKKKPPTQRQVNKKEKPKQMKFADSPAVAQLEEAAATNRTGLPDQLKAGVESLSGLSLDDVKVHYNSGKPSQLNALAYAQGTDVHVGPGQEKHLPHEAWHIVQQKQGRVKPTIQMKVGVPVNDDPGLEKEADAMGAKALQRRKDEGASNSLSGHAEGCACATCSGSAHALSQRKPDPRVTVTQRVCALCDAEGRRYDDNHSLATCPYVEGEVEEEVKEVKEEKDAPAAAAPSRWSGRPRGEGPTGRRDRSGNPHHDYQKKKWAAKKHRNKAKGSG